MEKDKVLPLVVLPSDIGPDVRTRIFLSDAVGAVLGAAKQQRDADWERVEPLIEALLAVYTEIELQNVPGGSGELNLLVQEALAKTLEVKP